MNFPEGFRKAGLAIAGTLAGVTVLLVFFEIFLMRTHAYEVSNWQDPLFTEAMRKSYRFSSDRLIGWEQDPSVSLAHINTLGFMGTATEHIRKRRGVRRIVVIGDSITEQAVYVRKLEELLNDAGRGDRFEFWYSACGGYSVLNYYGLLRSRVFAAKPDLVIIGFCLNDVSFTGAPVVMKDTLTGKLRLISQAREGSVFCVLPIEPALFLRSRAYRFLAITASRVFSGSPPQKDADAVVCRWAFRKIKELARAHDTTVIGVIFPYFKSGYDDKDTDARQLIREGLKDAGIPYLDLHGRFPDIDDARWRQVRQDHVHPSNEAHELIAKELFSFLQEHRDFLGPSHNE